MARFVSADTIVPQPGNPQSLNRYAYVLGNPLKMTDPNGHCGGNILTGETYCSGFSTLTVDGNLTGLPAVIGPVSPPTIKAYYGSVSWYRPDDGVILVYSTQSSAQLRQEWVLAHGEASALGATGFAEVRSVRIDPLWGGGEATSFEETVVGGGPAAKVPIFGGVGVEVEYGSVSGWDTQVEGRLLGGELELSPGSLKLGYVPDFGPGGRIGLDYQGSDPQWLLSSYEYLSDVGLDAFGERHAPVGSRLTYMEIVRGYYWESWGRPRYTSGLQAARSDLGYNGLRVPYEEVP